MSTKPTSGHGAGLLAWYVSEEGVRVELHRGENGYYTVSRQDGARMATLIDERRAKEHYARAKRLGGVEPWR